MNQYFYVELIGVVAVILLLFSKSYHVFGGKQRTIHRYRKQPAAQGEKRQKTSASIDLSQPIPYHDLADNHEYFKNVRDDLPVYSVEVVADETQLAQFWMDLGEPERAIKILESRWGKDLPESQAIWLYLLELYEIVGDRQKHARLSDDFEQVFQCKAQVWLGNTHQNQEFERLSA